MPIFLFIVIYVAFNGLGVCDCLVCFGMPFLIYVYHIFCRVLAICAVLGLGQDEVFMYD